MRDGPLRVLALGALLAFAVPYGCDRDDLPAERQEGSVGAKGAGASSPPVAGPEPTTPSANPAGGTPVGGAFARAELVPVGGSGVSGDVVFKEVGSLGVQVELEVSGLPAPGDPEEPEPYFAQVHGGSCSEAPRGGGQEPEDEHGEDHHGHDHEHGGGPSLALVRLDRFFGAAPEYADHPEYEDPPADGLPGNIDAPFSVGASADGTGSVSSLLEGAEPEDLTSGGPKYVDLRAPSHGAPGDWPALACANLG
jgi:hypothetical protein